MQNDRYKDWGLQNYRSRSSEKPKAATPLRHGYNQLKVFTSRDWGSYIEKLGQSLKYGIGEMV